MWEEFPGGNGIGSQRSLHQCWVDFQQQHIAGIGVETLVGGGDLFSPGAVDEANVGQGEAAGGDAVAPLLLRFLPVDGEGQMKQGLVHWNWDGVGRNCSP